MGLGRFPSSVLGAYNFNVVGKSVYFNVQTNSTVKYTRGKFENGTLPRHAPIHLLWVQRPVLAAFYDSV